MSRAEYDGIADWYDEAIRTGPQSFNHGLVIPTLMGLIGDLEGRRVCDLACGQGVVARLLARRGAETTGVDISRRLLDIARRYERDEPLGLSYVLGDAQNLEKIEDASFDGVVCNLGLMDIPDLNACLRSVARALRPRGWFVFSVTHPCFLTPHSPRWTRDEGGAISLEVNGYFAEGYWRSHSPNGIRGKVGSYHRTLSSYVNALTTAGLELEQLDEPRAAGTVAERFPGYLEVAPFLVARCRRGVPAPAEAGPAA